MESGLILSRSLVGYWLKVSLEKTKPHIFSYIKSIFFSIFSPFLNGKEEKSTICTKMFCSVVT